MAKWFVRDELSRDEFLFGGPGYRLPGRAQRAGDSPWRLGDLLLARKISSKSGQLADRTTRQKPSFSFTSFVAPHVFLSEFSPLFPPGRDLH